MDEIQVHCSFIVSAQGVMEAQFEIYSLDNHTFLTQNIESNSHLQADPGLGWKLRDVYPMMMLIIRPKEEGRGQSCELSLLDGCLQDGGWIMGILFYKLFYLYIFFGLEVSKQLFIRLNNNGKLHL